MTMAEKKRVYGELSIQQGPRGAQWMLKGIPPHVAIRLKHLFPRIPKTSTAPFYFPVDDTHSADLHWFVQRYPMLIKPSDERRLNKLTRAFEQAQAELERILSPDWTPPPLGGVLCLNPGQEIRVYQTVAIEMGYRRRGLLLGDDGGLGKTYTAAGFCLKPGTLPAAVVVQTHLQGQWQKKVTAFTNLRVHKIKEARPYNLPEADIYIFRYSQIRGWTDFFATRFFKAAIFDEIQDLRRGDASDKGKAAIVLADNADYRLGLSATPIYNYGAEIWNIMRVIDPTVLGPYEDFAREWLVDDKIVKDPEALGSYLREQHVFLRRTKGDIGQNDQPPNTWSEVVETDQETLRSVEDLARQLALKTISGSFVERGLAGRELDLLARHTTGVAKAKGVAAYARILLEAKVPLLLAGWHRDVYDIWLKELAAYNPVMYTGSESPKQKEDAVQAFMGGKTNCFIISLRSGAGLDELQHHCSTILFGELDWSKEIHKQLILRLDREGQKEQVTAVFLVSEDGSDPPMIDMLAVKASQATGIVDLGLVPPSEPPDTSRMRALAKQYLNKHDLRDLDKLEPEVEVA